MFIRKFFLFLLANIFSFGNLLNAQTETEPFVIVLGIAQDGGFPHAGCQNNCCNSAWENDSLSKFVVSLALADPVAKKWWLFEATPDFRDQLQLFSVITDGEYPFLPDGIFLTHAHIGHYSGLIQLGREVMNTKNIPVYVLPKMKIFLENNGPWNQLVSLNNISLIELKAGNSMGLSELNRLIEVTFFTVPHRDEFSETAGYLITTPSKKYLFIPDIDKWSKFEMDIIALVKNSDYAFLDATFYREGEIQGRSMSEIPHPFVGETIELFKNETIEVKSKIHFIHFNHTNPLLWDTKTQQELKSKGFNCARQGQIYY